MRRRGLNAGAIPSCEALCDSHKTRPSAARRLGIGFSLSGYSTELILANRRLAAAGFTTFGITCSQGSDLLTEADHGLLITDGFQAGLTRHAKSAAAELAVQNALAVLEGRVPPNLVTTLKEPRARP